MQMCFVRFLRSKLAKIVVLEQCRSTLSLPTLLDNQSTI
jgi:hypothetical protein